MKFMNLKKYRPRIHAGKAAFCGGLVAMTAAVNAAVPQSLTTALTEAKADSLDVGGIVLGIIASIFALFLLRRVMK